MNSLHPLPQNGTIGIMAPSSPVDETELQKGVTYFEKLGYRVITTASCYNRDNYLAGSAESRSFDFMELINNTAVDAVFFARGGFGSIAMLPLLDYRSIARARKLLVRFSDITALQWGIYAKTGLPSLSAGMPTTDFNRHPVSPVFEENFWTIINTGMIEFATGTLFNNIFGKFNGVALPGTLSVATRLAGSPYCPDFNNTIPVFEDVGESRHKIEGSLWQAKLAGWFDQCNAVLLGDFSSPEKETFRDNPSLEEIYGRIFSDSNIPVITGIPYGHIENKIPIPLGVEISLSLEPSVIITSNDILFDF